MGQQQSDSLAHISGSALGLNTDDKIKMDIEETPDGTKRLVIDKVEPILQTIEELFTGYTGGSFQAEIQEMKPLGKELW